MCEGLLFCLGIPGRANREGRFATRPSFLRAAVNGRSGANFTHSMIVGNRQVSG